MKTIIAIIVTIVAALSFLVFDNTDYDAAKARYIERYGVEAGSYLFYKSLR